MDLSHDAWVAVGAGVTELCGMVTAITVAHIKTKRQVEEVRRLAEPTGNGFARGVLRSFERIEGQLTRVEGKIDDHVASHADQDIRRS